MVKYFKFSRGLPECGPCGHWPQLHHGLLSVKCAEILRPKKEILVLALTIIALVAVSVISGLHFAWAGKIWWPISDETKLVRAVAGFPNVERMPPPTACLLVAVALCCVALLLLADSLQSEPSPAVAFALLVAGLVFLGRGAVGFTPFWFRATPEQPFRRLDLKYYSPLCLAIGAIIVAAALS